MFILQIQQVKVKVRTGKHKFGRTCRYHWNICIYRNTHLTYQCYVILLFCTVQQEMNSCKNNTSPGRFLSLSSTKHTYIYLTTAHHTIRNVLNICYISHNVVFHIIHSSYASELFLLCYLINYPISRKKQDMQNVFLQCYTLQGNSCSHHFFFFSSSNADLSLLVDMHYHTLYT